MSLHQRPTLVLAYGPADLMEAVGRCVNAVAACELALYEHLSTAAQSLLVDPAVGVLLVYIDGPQCRLAVRELIQLAQQRRPAVPVVVLAEADQHDHCGEFLSWGAADCLTRPLNLSRLTFLIDFLTLRVRSLPEAATQPVPSPADGILSLSGGLSFVTAGSQSPLAMARRLSQVDSSVLLAGETGSGKSSLARLIHDLSPRQKRPLVVVNCGAIPEALLESELFGHQQGAFTGASRDHNGKFALAEDGTIFLDEIDALSLASQSSLLRVVEDRCYEPVGSGASRQIRSRLIFATNRDLAEEVRAGRFRADLYYRLNVISVTVPPLRQRAAAIGPLAVAFLDQLRARGNTKVRRISAAALDRLRAYSWPGNVRELRNVIERVAVFCDCAEVDVHDLPEEIRLAVPRQPARSAESGAERLTGKSALTHARRAAERNEIVSALARCRDNRSRAAELLGISRAAFYKKLHQLGLS